KLGDGAGELRELRREREADPRRLRARLAQRQGAPPGAAADEACAERDLADEAVSPLRAGQRRLDERAQRAPERQFVRDSLRERERLGELGRRPATAHMRGRSASRQAPGAPAVRPQSFGDGAARKPGKLSQPANSERVELLVALPVERQQRQRERCEEAADLLVADDEQLARLRDRCGGERGEAAPRRSEARVPRRPTAASARRSAGSSPPYSRSTPRVSKYATPVAAGSTAKPASSSERTTSSHACSAAAGSGSTSTSRGHVASASPRRIRGRTPASSAAAVTG